MPNQVDIEALRRLLVLSSPGPWASRLRRRGSRIEKSTSSSVVDHDGQAIVDFQDAASEADRTLIATMRNVLPALLDELEELRRKDEDARDAAIERDLAE